MDQLASKLRKIKENSTQTTGGFCLTDFHASDANNGLKLFRLHFRRQGALRPTSFDVSIHYSSNFVVDYRDRDQDTTRLHFADSEAVLDYLTAK
ncbi:hypothetical protein GCM10027299_44010 [Larkinella ripae]